MRIKWGEHGISVMSGSWNTGPCFLCGVLPKVITLLQLLINSHSVLCSRHMKSTQASWMHCNSVNSNCWSWSPSAMARSSQTLTPPTRSCWSPALTFLSLGTLHVCYQTQMTVQWSTPNRLRNPSFESFCPTSRGQW